MRGVGEQPPDPFAAGHAADAAGNTASPCRARGGVRMRRIRRRLAALLKLAYMAALPPIDRKLAQELDEIGAEIMRGVISGASSRDR